MNKVHCNIILTVTTRSTKLCPRIGIVSYKTFYIYKNERAK